MSKLLTFANLNCELKKKKKGLSVVNKTSHLHINQGPKTSCGGDLEAMKQMGSQADI